MSAQQSGWLTLRCRQAQASQETARLRREAGIVGRGKAALSLLDLGFCTWGSEYLSQTSCYISALSHAVGGEDCYTISAVPEVCAGPELLGTAQLPVCCALPGCRAMIEKSGLTQIATGLGGLCCRVFGLPELCGMLLAHLLSAQQIAIMGCQLLIDPITYPPAGRSEHQEGGMPLLDAPASAHIWGLAALPWQGNTDEKHSPSSAHSKRIMGRGT